MQTTMHGQNRKDSDRIGILIVDRDNMGHDLDYGIFDSFGAVEIRDYTRDADLGVVLAESRPDIVVANRPLFTAHVLKSARGLRLICLTATGTNTVDLEAARHEGIAVCNIVGYSTESVAQHTFALALSIICRLSRFQSSIHGWYQRQTDARAGESGDLSIPWTDLSVPFSELSGKTWGIIGLGSIGRRVAEIASCFGCSVIWTSPSGSSRKEAWPQTDLDTLISDSDVISIHSPINDHTRGLIGERELRKLKPSAVLINTGRGGIVDEIALANILTEGRILGAGIDVLWPEPPAAENPLLRIDDPDRLVLTPHVAWAAVEARQRALRECALNIEAFLSGKKRNRVV